MRFKQQNWTVLLSCRQSLQSKHKQSHHCDKRRGLPLATRVPGRMHAWGGGHTYICACQRCSNEWEQECDCQGQRHQCCGHCCVYFHSHWWILAWDNVDCLWPSSAHTHDASSWNHFLLVLEPEKASVQPLFHAFIGYDVVSAFRGKAKKSAWQTWTVCNEVSATSTRLSRCSTAVEEEEPCNKGALAKNESALSSV